MRTSTVSAFVGLSLLAGGGALVAWRAVWPASPIARGVMVDERVVPQGREAALAWLGARAEALSTRTVCFHIDDRILEASFADLGIALDVDAIFDDARRVAREGSTWDRLRDARRARRGYVDLPLRWKVDAARARVVIEGFAPEVLRAPVEARIDLMKHERVPDQPGRELDVETSIARLLATRHDDREIVDLATRPVPAKVAIGGLTSVHIERMVSSYETTFSLLGSGANRAVNIRRAISFLDGIVLAPGQALSFNEVVGPRTKDRGFALAPEIQADEMQLGYGGGTCQASTTLYAAAVFGALEVLERQAHSRPSHYTQMGLDATVSYPLADLKIRNPLPFPVLIHGFFPNPTTVRVEILGGDPIARVEYLYGVSSTEDFVRRIQVKPELSPGQRVLHQRGVMGFDVTSVVRLHYYDGREDERHYFSGYRPAPEIYWVAPGYDVATLPPLPEHARGVERVEAGVGG